MGGDEECRVGHLHPIRLFSESLARKELGPWGSVAEKVARGLTPILKELSLVVRHAIIFIPVSLGSWAAVMAVSKRMGSDQTFSS